MRSGHGIYYIFNKIFTLSLLSLCIKDLMLILQIPFTQLTTMRMQGNKFRLVTV